MKKLLVKTSKFLSLILRHAPQKIGLQLDEQGWAEVEELIIAACKHNNTSANSHHNNRKGPGKR